MTGLRDLETFPWTSLRAFEAASRLGSFKAAARELSVTPTAISHQVKRLETHLGLALFERLHRALQLTPAGLELAAETQDAFGRLRQLVASLRDGTATGSQTLTVSAVPSLAAKWLAPRLHAFQAAHPRITLRIVADETLVDLRRDRLVDVALRYGPGPYGDAVHAERLWEHGELIAVCAPDVAKDRSLRTPSGLARHMLIRTAAPASGKRGQSLHGDWRAWLTAAGIQIDGALQKALSGPLFSASQLAIEAAAAGKGIALAPAVLVERDIASGRLKRLFQVSVPDSNAYWLVCRVDRLEEARIRTFMKWIRAQAAEPPQMPRR
jgi:LysR family transcriptional regulator, glycine cleavage system transcriptional activator